MGLHGTHHEKEKASSKCEELSWLCEQLGESNQRGWWNLRKCGEERALAMLKVNCSDVLLLRQIPDRNKRKDTRFILVSEIVVHSLWHHGGRTMYAVHPTMNKKQGARERQPSKHTSSGLLPSRSYLLKFPETLKTVSPGNQVLNTWACAHFMLKPQQEI